MKFNKTLFGKIEKKEVNILTEKIKAKTYKSTNLSRKTLIKSILAQFKNPPHEKKSSYQRFLQTH